MQTVIKFSQNGIPQPVSVVPPPEIAVPTIWSVDFPENH